VSTEDALQAALAGEHAVVYGYGVVGARLMGLPDERAAVSGYNTHRARRATLELLVAQAGGEPTPAAAGYELGGPVFTTSQARALAARLEHGAAATYCALVAAATGTTRSAAAGWLVDAAVREAFWSGRPDTFPGLGPGGP